MMQGMIKKFAAKLLSSERGIESISNMVEKEILKKMREIGADSIRASKSQEKGIVFHGINNETKNVFQIEPDTLFVFMGIKLPVKNEHLLLVSSGSNSADTAVIFKNGDILHIAIFEKKNLLLQGELKTAIKKLISENADLVMQEINKD